MASTTRHARLVALLATLGCAGPAVVSNRDPNADFGSYETYGFPDRLATDDDRYSSLLSKFLKSAASRELEARGYERSDEPDLLVYFDVKTREKLRYTHTPNVYFGFRRYHYWSSFGVYDTSVTYYREGTLNVDLVDRRANQLVWEAAVVGRVTDDVREHLERTVDEAIADVFAAYPFVAGRSEPVTDAD